MLEVGYGEIVIQPYSSLIAFDLDPRQSLPLLPITAQKTYSLFMFAQRCMYHPTVEKYL